MELKQSLTNSLDQLGYAKDKKAQKWLEQGENILLSCSVIKFNKRNKRQERNLIVTNKAVLNLSAATTGLLGSGPSLKRKISLDKIAGMTLSNMSTEFVLHVPSEYDYRYSQFELRTDIIGIIIDQYFLLSGKGLPVNYKEDVFLEKFTTTKNEKKKGESRMPSGGTVMSGGEFRNKSSGKADKAPEKSTLYSIDDQEVSFADFDCVKVLGRGAYGKVMLVRKKSSGELYAMKSLRKEEMIEQGQVENVKSEKKVLQHLNNPFLVKLSYCFQTSDKIFLVMDFMKGGELFTHLRQSTRFEESRARFYGAQILSALAHLHSESYLYRDLKPENVLLDAEGNIALTDFGLAKKIDREMAETMCGTPEYMAPEVIDPQPYGKAADYWSLGIIIYEMLIGLTPFYNHNQNIMYVLIKEGELRFPDKVIQLSPEAKDLISKLLTKRPEERLGYGSAEEIKNHPWFAPIDWTALQEKRVPPPFKPRVAGDQWIANFDDEFTKEEPVCSFAPIQDMQQLDEYNNNEFNQF